MIQQSIKSVNRPSTIGVWGVEWLVVVICVFMTRVSQNHGFKSIIYLMSFTNRCSRPYTLHRALLYMSVLYSPYRFDGHWSLRQSVSCSCFKEPSVSFLVVSVEEETNSEIGLPDLSSRSALQDSDVTKWDTDQRTPWKCIPHATLQNQIVLPLDIREEF